MVMVTSSNRPAQTNSKGRQVSACHKTRSHLGAVLADGANKALDNASVDLQPKHKAFICTVKDAEQLSKSPT